MVVRRVRIILVTRNEEGGEPLKLVVDAMKEAGAHVELSGGAVDRLEVDYRVDEQLETAVREHAASELDKNAAAKKKKSPRSARRPTRAEKAAAKGGLLAAVKSIPRVLVRLVEWAANVFG